MSYANYNYAIEEADDQRTWDGSLVPDCAPRTEEIVSELVEISGMAHSERTECTDRYWKKFENLLNACGQVAYYWHMVQNVKEAAHNQAKDIAEKYGRSLTYYREQRKAWVFEAKRAFALWQMVAYEQGVGFHFDDQGRDFLNSLIDSDRRDCARDTIRYAKPKGILLTPDEIERRYVDRLRRRKERQRKLQKGSSL